MIFLSKNDFPVPALPVKNTLLPFFIISRIWFCSLVNVTDFARIFDGLTPLIFDIVRYFGTLGSSFCFLLLSLGLEASSFINGLFFEAGFTFEGPAFAGFVIWVVFSLYLWATWRSLIVSGDISSNSWVFPDNNFCLWLRNPLSLRQSCFVWEI